MADKQRVVVTGIGLVTPVGSDTTTAWQTLCQGRSGISLNDRCQLGNYSCRVAGLVRGEQPLLDAVLSAKQQTKTDRFIHLAVMAGDQALKDAGCTQGPLFRPDRCGVYLGVGIGGLGSISQGILDMHERGLKRLSPLLIPKVISNQAASWLSMLWNLQGPANAIVSACSSGADALGLALRAIRDGYADCMVAGGAESCIESVAIAGFGNMRTLSTWDGDPCCASRPFDKRRSGFVLAEGAGVLVLEREDFARKRGAHIYAELVGYGATADAYHITAMHPEGKGAQLAIHSALSDAGIDASAVGYINAHGTSTIMNDAIETMTLKQVFGPLIDPRVKDHIVVSSTKSMTGHMLGAAGGVEAGITALALQAQLFPPTINLDEQDPVCDLDYLAHQAREKKVAYALSNSFGFGGSNAVLAFKRWQ